MCVSPYIVESRDGKKMPVPCGHCYDCLERWSSDWRFRLNEEWKRSQVCLYLTLTYAPEFSPVAYNDEAGEWQTYIEKSEVQKFLKRVRKNCEALRENFRYFAIGEYGGEYNRCHAHIILFIKNDHGMTYAQYHRLFSYCWSDPKTHQQKGFIKLKITEQRHIKYVTKYFNKLDKSSHIVPPFRLMSKSLGLSYLSDRMVDYFFETFRYAVPAPFSKGYVALPRYYRKKLDEYSVRSPFLKTAGLTFSDVLRMQPFESRGLQVHFNEFCDNFEKHYSDIYREYVHNCRVNGYRIFRLTTMQVFKEFCSRIKEVSDAQHLSARKIEDICVKHKFTRLTPKDLEKVHIPP